MNITRIEGAAAAIITPFSRKIVNEVDYEVDYEGLRKNVEFQNIYADFVVVNGTTGESATMTEKEQESVAEAVIEAAKIPVVAGTGSNCTRKALHMTRHAKDIGCAAALLVYPYYNRPPYDKAKKHYFGLIAGKVDIPIIIYLVPSRTGKNTELPVEDVVELAREHSNIVGIKEATGKPERTKQILEALKAAGRKDFIVYSGDDGLNYDICRNGGRGSISVIANILPDMVAEEIRMLNGGKMKAAEGLQKLMNPFCDAVFLETNPIGVKEAMNLLGMPAGPLRPPLGNMLPENSGKLKALIKELEAAGRLKNVRKFYG